MDRSGSSIGSNGLQIVLICQYPTNACHRSFGSPVPSLSFLVLRCQAIQHCRSLGQLPNGALFLRLCPSSLSCFGGRLIDLGIERPRQLHKTVSCWTA